MIRRPPRSTQSRSSAASDVYKRQEEEVPAAYKEHCERTRCIYSLKFEGLGEIRYCARGRRKWFEAVCLKHADDGCCCMRERTAIAGHFQGQGKPLGQLVCWLRRHGKAPSRKEHVDMKPKIFWEAERIAARADFFALGAPARPLFENEDPKPNSDEDCLREPRRSP